MSEDEILAKAFKQAKANGWQPLIQKYAFKVDTEPQLGVIEYIEPFIFDHDFARSLWGEGLMEDSLGLVEYAVFENGLWDANDGLQFNGRRWQFHLQQMVIADNPIKYLGENI